MREIELVTPGSFDDRFGEIRAVHEWMRKTGRPSPPDTWLGVVEGGRLLGAVHASPNLGQASQVLVEIGKPDRPDVEWLRRYVDLVGSLEEVAVDLDVRRRGLAAALVRAGLAELQQRGVRAVSGFACDTGSVELFRALKFTIGRLGESVPDHIAAGMHTYWTEGTPEDGRYFWKVLPALGDAFGLPYGAREAAARRAVGCP